MSNIKTYTRASRAPIPFDSLHPGSLFVIHAERSRGYTFSKDHALYRKARDGYYSTDSADAERAIVLYPTDLVWPMALKRKE